MAPRRACVCVCAGMTSDSTESEGHRARGRVRDAWVCFGRLWRRNATRVGAEGWRGREQLE
eukprot:3121645-Rhodomonas_salina.1